MTSIEAAVIEKNSSANRRGAGKVRYRSTIPPVSNGATRAIDAAASTLFCEAEVVRKGKSRWPMMTREAIERPASTLPTRTRRELASTMRVGDLVFIRIRFPPFTAIASATGTWTNHVGIVVDFNRSGPIIAESRLPISRRTALAAYLRRSEGGRVAVLRLPRRLTDRESERVREAAYVRLGRVYDTGFNIDSHRQFCSRFVYEILSEACGESRGEISTLGALLERRPDTDLRLWRLWYFGRIPWARRTITPASLYLDPALQVAFDGKLATQSLLHRR